MQLITPDTIKNRFVSSIFLLTQQIRFNGLRRKTWLGF